MRSAYIHIYKETLEEDSLLLSLIPTLWNTDAAQNITIAFCHVKYLVLSVQLSKIQRSSIQTHIFWGLTKGVFGILAWRTIERDEGLFDCHKSCRFVVFVERWIDW